jgi:predicted ATPase
MGARQYAAEGLKLYDVGRDAAKVAQFQVDGRSGCMTYGIWPTWMLGFPEQAMRLADDALRHARSLKHPHTLTVALIFTAVTRLLLRESEQARRESEEAARLSLEHGFPQWSPWAEAVSGAAVAGLGQFELGIARMSEGIAAWRRLESKAVLPLFFALKAEALLAWQRPADALLAANEGLAVVRETGERFYEAELYRLRGEAVLPDDPTAAERDFLRAIEVSHELSAKSLELRAAMSLARFWRDRDRQDEARRLLADVYGWFTEGFETGDLQTAKALLDELCR